MVNISISADLIKNLRSRTGIGLLECKRALIEENGDIESAIDNLRKSGKLNAVKKNNNITNQGIIFSNIKNNFGVMLELNCETDFVSKDNLFINFGQNIILKSLEKKIKNIDQIRSEFEEKRTDLILKFGENINIRRFCWIEGENIYSYVHGIRIGVLVSAIGLNKVMLKNIAMHIAASKPEYLHPNNIPSTEWNREYQIQSELVKNLKKPSDVLNKIIQGRMKKFTNSISLTGQNFIIDPTKTVGEILNENNSHIISFSRFELGENMSK
ncbi:translation elongation factor Ts [Buchnera aphidicola]|uniref:Elongation factor Ts n=1 Tax=Buchnera aphidicola subsp. Uroleucon sonchi TaxID=118118 RepID=A0A6C1FGY4_BUCUN|nr:translation elongation factor Ts [Buchnera aphidicola]QIE01959.1 elongation factor Ts [Buchnera aphidicola (Uroleucon sonchi)]